MKTDIIRKIRRLFRKEENPDFEGSLSFSCNPRSLECALSLLVIADTHSALHLNEKMKREFERTATENEYDLCCILGDVHDYDLRVIMQSVPAEKTVCLLGNHDRFDLLDHYGLKSLNGKVLEISGIRIAGIQGSFRYADKSFPSFTHDESRRFLERMPYADILLSHDGPYTVNNGRPSHDGLKGITEYLYAKAVPLNIHGHIHKSYCRLLKNGTVEKSV